MYSYYTRRKIVEQFLPYKINKNIQIIFVELRTNFTCLKIKYQNCKIKSTLQLLVIHSSDYYLISKVNHTIFKTVRTLKIYFTKCKKYLTIYD